MKDVKALRIGPSWEIVLHMRHNRKEKCTLLEDLSMKQANFVMHRSGSGFSFVSHACAVVCAHGRQACIQSDHTDCVEYLLEKCCPNPNICWKHNQLSRTKNSTPNFDSVSAVQKEDRTEFDLGTFHARTLAPRTKEKLHGVKHDSSSFAEQQEPFRPLARSGFLYALSGADMSPLYTILLSQ